MSIPRRVSKHTLLMASAWLLGGGLLLPGQASADFFRMPSGGTSWIEVSSNQCDQGTPLLGGDCFGAKNVLPSMEYSRELPASILAGGGVTPNAIQLSNTGATSGSGAFVLGATGGMFTVNGSGNTPVTVTATLQIDAQVVKVGSVKSSGVISAKIGNWSFEPVESDLNFRVTGGVRDAFSCHSTCDGLVLQDKLVTRTLSVVPGQPFNLGFQLDTSTLSVLGPVTVSAQAKLGLAVGAEFGSNFYITGSNGYDSRVSPVPEPGTWAMMFAGLGLLGLRQSRQSRQIRRS